MRFVITSVMNTLETTSKLDTFQHKVLRLKLIRNYLLNIYFSLKVPFFFIFFLSGIDCVSNFLSLYLRNWNGLDYKEEILNLCEWFVFDSKVSLLNDFLAPLHTLLITADPDEKKLYLEMYGKLYTNLVSVLWMKLELN